MVEELRKSGVKIGSCTGYPMAIVDKLKIKASDQGYTPDVYVAADEVPQARPCPYMVCILCVMYQMCYLIYKRLQRHFHHW